VATVPEDEESVQVGPPEVKVAPLTPHAGIVAFAWPTWNTPVFLIQTGVIRVVLFAGVTPKFIAVGVEVFVQVIGT
jgi:hypothetical protein